MKRSCDILHPAEKEGKTAYLCNELKTDEPSRRIFAVNRYLS